MKKFISSLAIVLTLATSALPMSSSALTDPNADGSISIQDSLLILQYISGVIEPIDLLALDFNGDYIVDYVDYLSVKNYLLTGQV